MNQLPEAYNTSGKNVIPATYTEECVALKDFPVLTIAF